MPTLRDVVPLVDPARRGSDTDAVVKEIAKVQIVVRDAVQVALSATGKSLNAIGNSGYGFYVVYDLLLGAYPSPSRKFDGQPPILYRARFYGEPSSAGEVRLTPTTRPRVVVGDVAREFVNNRLRYARYVASPCAFCQHRTITLWQRMLARYGKDVVRCRACQRPYSLDAACVKRFTAPLAYFSAGLCVWLAGRFDSYSLLVIAVGIFVVSEAVVLALAPQRLR